MPSIWFAYHVIACMWIWWTWNPETALQHSRLAKIDFWTLFSSLVMEGLHFFKVILKILLLIQSYSYSFRILVCGDETQKPFPLLVWHLSQRKLLYDLRIPHHDFITSLSAITHEGSYVCVVTKELNEPAPNFIVVYDLQSGTLFKKWKPSCNTVSLAISQTNACVIAGLEDARILIWDLITGNCKYVLVGHTAPVTLLKLDPTGTILLSADKDGRDRSVRLWELSTGKQIDLNCLLWIE